MNTNDFLLHAVCYEERACQLLYFRCRKRSKKGLLQPWILRALNNPQSSILDTSFSRYQGPRFKCLLVTIRKSASKPPCSECAKKVYEESGLKIPFHKFPEDRDLFKKWIVAIRRDVGWDGKYLLPRRPSLWKRTNPWAARPWQPLFSNHKSELLKISYRLQLTQHQQLQKTHKFVHIQFLIHISTNIYRNNTYNMSF